MYRRHEQPVTRASNGQGVIYVNVVESTSQDEYTLQSRCSGFRSVVTTTLNTVFFTLRVLVPTNRDETTWMASRLSSHSPAIAQITVSSDGIHLVRTNDLQL